MPAIARNCREVCSGGGGPLLPPPLPPPPCPQAATVKRRRRSGRAGVVDARIIIGHLSCAIGVTDSVVELSCVASVGGCATPVPAPPALHRSRFRRLRGALPRPRSYILHARVGATSCRSPRGFGNVRGRGGKSQRCAALRRR